MSDEMKKVTTNEEITEATGVVEEAGSPVTGIKKPEPVAVPKPTPGLDAVRAKLSD